MELQTGEPLYQIMLARYYGAGIARFLSADIGVDSRLDIPQSWNQFVYVRNNPVSSTDPQGLAVQPIGVAFDFIRDTLSDELGAMLRLDSNGFIAPDSLPDISSIEQNFNDLKELVGSANIVEVYGSEAPVIAGPPVQYMEKFYYNEPGDSFLGFAAAPDGSGPQSSPTNSFVVSLYNGPAVPAEQMQSTTAHELYGHVLLCLMGGPWTHGEPAADNHMDSVGDRPTKSAKQSDRWKNRTTFSKTVAGHGTKTTLGGVSQSDVLAGD